MDEDDILKNKILIKKLLFSTKRKNISNLFDYMEEVGYFESPCSTKFHGSYKGGLAEHSINVLKAIVALNKYTNANIPKDSMIIVALTHDLCKAGLYNQSDFDGTYHTNKQHPKGHGALSEHRVSQHIVLTELEKGMIRFHMGMYGSTEFSSEYISEYSIKELSQEFNNESAYKLVYLSDELATFKENVLEKKLREGKI